MRLLVYVVVIAAFLLTGCASTGVKQAQVTRISPEELAKLMPPAVATYTLSEIMADAKQGKPADEIIAKIKATNSRYELTPTEVVDLNKQGLDSKVLDYMQQSNELAKQNAMADEINKREKETFEAQKQLRRERDLARNQFYDPFWGPGFGAFYGRPWIGPIGPAGRLWRGNRFGWGINYGYPMWW